MCWGLTEAGAGAVAAVNVAANAAAAVGGAVAVVAAVNAASTFVLLSSELHYELP